MQIATCCTNKTSQTRPFRADIRNEINRINRRIKKRVSEES